mmetsp:Transcript_1924/g.6263  ORF Transcript_1924/g.6263 Transcript_1924/m.6263 type:complete len:252 (+) Transcript_1924:147-902(+)
MQAARMMTRITAPRRCLTPSRSRTPRSCLCSPSAWARSAACAFGCIRRFPLPPPASPPTPSGAQACSRSRIRSCCTGRRFGARRCSTSSATVGRRGRWAFPPTRPRSSSGPLEGSPPSAARRRCARTLRSRSPAPCRTRSWRARSRRSSSLSRTATGGAAGGRGCARTTWPPRSASTAPCSMCSCSSPTSRCPPSRSTAAASSPTCSSRRGTRRPRRRRSSSGLHWRVCSRSPCTPSSSSRRQRPAACCSA